MNRNEYLTFIIIALYSLFIYITRGMGVSFHGISLMAWLLLGLYFLAPVVSLIMIYSDKSESR